MDGHLARRRSSIDSDNVISPTIYQPSNSNLSLLIFMNSFHLIYYNLLVNIKTYQPSVPILYSLQSVCLTVSVYNDLTQA